MQAQLGQIMNNIQKDQKPTQHHQWGGQTTPTPGPTPIRTPYKETAPPAPGVSKGTCYLFSLPPAAAGVPIKPCLNFLSGLLSISID